MGAVGTQAATGSGDPPVSACVVWMAEVGLPHACGGTRVGAGLPFRLEQPPSLKARATSVSREMGNPLFLPLHRPLEAKRAGAPWTPGPSWRTPHTSRGGPVPLHTAQYLRTRPPKARGLLLIKKQDISSFLPISWFALGDQPSPSRRGHCRQSPSAAGWVPASRGGQARWVQHEPHLLSAAAVAVRPWEVLEHKITLMAGVLTPAGPRGWERRGTALCLVGQGVLE